jgi:hypothetical protein
MRSQRTTSLVGLTVVASSLVAAAALPPPVAARAVMPVLAYVVTGDIRSELPNEDSPKEVADSLIKAARPALGTSVPMVSAALEHAPVSCDSIVTHHGARSCDVVVLMHHPVRAGASVFEVVVAFNRWAPPSTIAEEQRPIPSSQLCPPPTRRASARSCRRQAFETLVTELLEHSRSHLH